MNIDLNFHNTFPPTLNYISRLLYLASEGDFFTRDEISKITGIPTGKISGKVEPHIFYAYYMGLTEKNLSKKNGKHKIELSPLGRVINHEDPGLVENITQLILHVYLTSPSHGAILWSSIIREILPKYKNGISTLILMDELSKRFTSKIKLGPFYSSYKDTFRDINLLTVEKDSIRRVPHKIKSEFIYVYALALFIEWEIKFKDSIEITSTNLEQLKFGATFGWDLEQEYFILEKLNEIDLLSLNRQLTPYTIIKHSDSSDVIKLLYSRLI